MFIPLHSVHLFRNQQKCGRLPSGITGRNAPESVVDLLRNDWSAWAGICKWDKHVDLKHDFILLDVTKNGERREIPINATLKKALQGLTRRIDVPYVFYSPDTGKPYKSISRSFKTALRKTGIKDFKFHDLRHTFASHLVMAGVDITTVSRLLGHKTLTMTLRYAHLAPSHMVKAVDVLDNALNEQKDRAVVVGVVQ